MPPDRSAAGRRFGEGLAMRRSRLVGGADDQRERADGGELSGTPPLGRPAPSVRRAWIAIP
ncbi:MAG: hypothetical protein ACK53L_01205 [Pirellulaceae bacterium]